MILQELVLFCGIGVLGLLVDVSVLYLLKSALGPFGARGISFFAAAVTTWFFNRQMTFKHRESSLTRRNELLAYICLMLVGGTINYLCYTWLVVSFEYVENNLFLGVAAGSLAGMFFNFLTSRLLLFRKS